jgi:hypothetical protein
MVSSLLSAALKKFSISAIRVSKPASTPVARVTSSAIALVLAATSVVLRVLTASRAACLATSIAPPSLVMFSIAVAFLLISSFTLVSS